MIFNPNLLILTVLTLLAISSYGAPTKYIVDFTFPAGCAGGNCKEIADALAVAVSGDLIMVRHNAAAYNVGAQTVDNRNLQFTGENSGALKATLNMHLVGGTGSGKWVFSNFAIINDADVPFVELQLTTGSPKIYIFEVELNNVANSNQVVINTRGSTTTGSPTVIIGIGTITTHKVIDQHDDTGNVHSSIVNCQISGIDQTTSFSFEGPLDGSFSFKGNTVTSTSTNAPNRMYLTKGSSGTTHHFFSKNHFDFDAISVTNNEVFHFETTGTANAYLSFYKNYMDINIAASAIKWDVTTTGEFYYVGEENTWDFNDANGAEEVFPINNDNGVQVVYVKGSAFVGRTNADVVSQIDVASNGVGGYVCLYLDDIDFFPDAPALHPALHVGLTVGGDVELQTNSNIWGNSINRVSLNSLTMGYVGDTTIPLQANLLLDSADLTAVKIQAAAGSVISNYDNKCNGGTPNTLPRFRMAEAVQDSATYNCNTPLTVDVDNNDIADPQNEALIVTAGSMFSARGYVTTEVSGQIQFSNSASLASSGGSDTFYYVLSDTTGGFDVAKVEVTVAPCSLTFNLFSGLKMYIPTRFTWTNNLSSAHKITVRLYETDKTTLLQTWFENRDISPSEYYHAASKLLPKEYVLKAETSGPSGNKEWWSANFYINVCTTMNPGKTEVCRHL